MLLWMVLITCIPVPVPVPVQIRISPSAVDGAIVTPTFVLGSRTTKGYLLPWPVTSVLGLWTGSEWNTKLILVYLKVDFSQQLNGSKTTLYGRWNYCYNF